MVQKLLLDSIVTAFACLFSSADYELSPIYLNSNQIYNVQNLTSMGCQLPAVLVLTGQIQQLSKLNRQQSQEIIRLKREIEQLKSSSILRSTTQLTPKPVALPRPNPAPLPSGCRQHDNGIVLIKASLNVAPFDVLCQQPNPHLGSWLVIANRFDGSVDFRRDWTEYKDGFGNLNGEFFIGLEKLYTITSSGDYELLILMENAAGEKRYARYTSFKIGNEAQKYKLARLGDYSGDAGDSLRYHIGMSFSTPGWAVYNVWLNCAGFYSGAWWYKGPLYWECYKSHLFGVYQRAGDEKLTVYKGMRWSSFNSEETGSLKRVVMLIKPKD